MSEVRCSDQVADEERELRNIVREGDPRKAQEWIERRATRIARDLRKYIERVKERA